MFASEYIHLVNQTDQYADYDPDKRKQISIYGLVGEIGSLTSAVKKTMLCKHQNTGSSEIVDELGDVMWYLFNLTVILEINDESDILTKDISHIRREVADPSDRGEKIRQVLDELDEDKREKFKQESEKLILQDKVSFDQYQKIAYLTARTEGEVLVAVCLSVLWQLGAELLRSMMPDLELDLNRTMKPRKNDIVIGEIVWHLSAIASVYDISLDHVIEQNAQKARFRTGTENESLYHDQKFPATQRLPRKFEISFVSISQNHARMYYEGKRLGDDLTDNFYEEDGYRFHDVMHLANAACLRWSPVLRSLFKLKRKFCPKTDEVEDGARAKIVEELVIKAVHAEGKRLQPLQDRENTQMFPEKGNITFGIIKTVAEYVKGLEVEKCQEWEWRKAIFEGTRVYHELCQEEQGTVTVDLENRSLTFEPVVCVGIAGVVRGLGTSSVDLDDMEQFNSWITDSEELVCQDKQSRTHLVATKIAILNSLGFSGTEQDVRCVEINISFMGADKISVKATGSVRERMWQKRVLEFKSTLNQTKTSLFCTVLALADADDAKE
ncbi:MAG: hypothetical protein OXC41_08115 [Gammaproteobacteria bacterium]|nr:hypothetical protein [Gammaproteobacteria bacterium]